MKEAVLRLLAISVTVVMFVAMAIFGLNFMGSQQSFNPLDHPLLNNQPSYFIADIVTVKKSVSKKFTHKIPFLSLITHKDEWVIKKDGPPKDQLLFEEFVKKNSPTKMALFVGTRINLGALVKILFDQGLQENVLIFANELKIHIELKKMAPRWLYVANPSQKMRAKLMDSFLLGSTTTYDFDFYVLNPAKEKPLSSTFINELQKRHKKILSKTSNSSYETLSFPQGNNTP